MLSNVPNPCCIALHTCVKIAATTSVVLSLAVIITQATMIHSANRIHHSSLLPLYKVLRTEYNDWKRKVDGDWAKMRRDMSSSSAGKFEEKLKLRLDFNENDGVEKRMLKEKSVRENLELPSLPDYAEMERVSYICGLNGLFGGIFQFCASLSLLWKLDKGNQTIIKVWIAVTGGVIFSLATCLLALLLQESPINLLYLTPSSEILFSVLGTDLLLTLYFLWIVLAYLYQGNRHEMRYYV